MDRRADNPVEVLVVDDQEQWREALRDVVGATPGLTVVGEARSGEASLDAAKRLGPRLVIMDVRMPGMGGIEATRRLVAAHPGIVVVLISGAGRDIDGLGPRDRVSFLHKEQVSPRTLAEAWAQHGVNGALPA